MKHHTHQPNRRSIRLKGYDYTQAGLYFVTICTHNREGLFGQVANGVMQLNEAGQVVANEWVQTAEIRHEIELDEWVVMPNHLHGIVVITSKDLGIVVGDLGIDLGIVGHTRYAGLATQLLRTHHPQRTFPFPHSQLHCKQPPKMANR